LHFFAAGFQMNSTMDSAIERQKSMDPEEFYVLIEKVGKGAFGEVYKGIVKGSKETVAVKVINLEEAKDEIEEIQNEISFLTQCRHPNVIRYLQSYAKGKRLWIVMELLVGSAHDMMKPKGLGPFPESDICVLATQLLSGLQYLHHEGKVHRDIKAANILISADGEAKFADFGVAGQITPFKKNLGSFAGTPHWIAPEMIKKQPYDEKVDIWSFGITLYELAIGDPPYSDATPARAMQNNIAIPIPELPNTFSKNFKDFLSLCLQIDPAKRLSATELLKQKFVKGVKKKKGFLQPRIEEFTRWRNRGGGDSDSDDDSVESKIDDDDDLVVWDFSSDPPKVESKEKADPDAAKSAEWLGKLKPPTKAQRANKAKKKRYH